MGGKKGNRTKGNTRPSSSGRTAEILSASGVSGFVGFTGLATEIPGFFGLGTSDDVESTVDPDFRMVMKKITKRDSVTRVKALQEFSDLCQSKDVPEVKGALPYWPRFFVKLAVDHDRRVREATHQANHHLAIKVKKDLAPYLKTMMGTWIVSMCDPYAPASSAAQEAFQVAFPASKQPEALEFCKDEIFNFISDILFHQTAKSLSDATISSPEEMDSKYIRLLASSLRALKLFITTVTDLKKEKTIQNVSDILDDNKFWKLAKHTEIEIQIAWYLFISSLCQHMPEVASKYVSKLAPLTLGHIEETQPVVASLVWESTLHLLVTIEDCWQYVNVQKAVFPQLWRLLRIGGNGNAHCIFKNLLPFLSKIPPGVCDPKDKFFSDFFSNFKQGLLNEKVQGSQSELKAVVQAFLECLRYVLLHNLRLDDKETKIRTDLVENNLLPVVELVVLDLNCHIQKPFFIELGIFLRSLECQLSQEKNTEVSQALQYVLEVFWGTVFNIFDKISISETETGVDIKLKRFAQLIQHLHCKANAVKPKKVAFSKESEKEEREIEPVGDSACFEEQPVGDFLLQNTHKLCCSVLHTLKSNPHLRHLELLSTIVNSVSSRDLFSRLFEEYFETTVQDHEDAIEKFIREVLLNWLENRDSLFGKEDNVISLVLGLMLHACMCIPKQKAFSVLNDQCSNQDFHVLEKLIVKLISSQSEMPSLYSWLKSDELGKQMVSLAVKIVENIDTFSQGCKPHDSWDLLKICFTATKDFEPLIGVEHLNDILKIFTSVLLKQPTGLESSLGVVVFVCELAQSLLESCMGCYQLTAVEDLLVCLFELSCNNKLLTEESQIHIRDTWCMGTEQLIKLQGGFLKDYGFLSKAASIIQSNLLRKSLHYKQLKELSAIEDNALYLLKTISKNLLDDEKSFLDKSCLTRALLDSVLPSKEVRSKMVNELSMQMSKCGLHHLNSPSTQISSTMEAKLPPFVIFIRFLIKILKAFVLKSSNLEEADLEKQKITVDTKEFLNEYLEDMYLIMAYGENMFVHPQSENACEILEMFLEISYVVHQVHAVLDNETLINSLNKLLESCKHNNEWFLMVFPCISNLFENNLNSLHTWTRSHLESLKPDVSSTAVCFQTIQFLLPCASVDDVQNLFVHVTSLFCNEEHCNIEFKNQCFATLVSCLQSTSSENLNSESILTVFRYLQNMKSASDIILLCEVQIKDNQQDDVKFSLTAAAFMSLYLTKSKIITEQWVLDLILCSLCGWISTTSKSTNMVFKNQENIMFIRNIFQLLSRVEEYVKSEDAKEHLPQLIDEWKGLYFPNIFSLVFPMYFDLCEKWSKEKRTSWEIEQMFNELSYSLRDLPPDDLLSSISQSSTSKTEIFGLTERLYSLLTSEIPAVQWGTHYLLMALMPKVSEISSKDVIKEDFDGNEDGNQRLPPLPLSKILSLSGQVVDTMLGEFHVEDCCLVKPFTDSYIYVLTYLLSWKHMLKIFSCSSSEIRSEYALNFQSSKLLDNLLLNLFRLIPNNPQINERTSMFTDFLNPTSASAPSSKLIQKVACQVYLNTLMQLPALVRHWWNKQDKRTADYVNRFTTTHVSGLISLEEIKSVQDTQLHFNNMSVKARPNAREVLAMYTMEDITIELVIRLPQNHPLGPVSIETGQRIGVGFSQWRHWMLQLTTFLTHQNGSILDALSLWKRNVDKRFEGVEECMICFYVLHGATCQLPRLTCKTCKKKFHSACLYKWFSTSQNASCPLCRNIF